MTDIGFERRTPPPGVAASLALWTAAWRHGAAAPDEVLTEIGAWGEQQLLRESQTATVGGSADLLRTLRQQPQAPRLLLPAPGDLCGLPREVAGAAVDAGEVLVAAGFPATAGVGSRVTEPAPATAVIPTYADGPVGSRIITWTTYPLPRWDEPSFPGVGESEYALRQSLSLAAELLERLGRPGGAGTVDRATVLQQMRDLDAIRTPATADVRPEKVLRRAAALLPVVGAARTGSGFGITNGEHATADTSLRELDRAVRWAVMGAVNAIVRDYERDRD